MAPLRGLLPSLFSTSSAAGMLGRPSSGSVGYYGHPYRSGGSGDWASSTASLVVLLALVLLVMAAYWIFRAIWLVMRVLWQHPHERRLWVALGACLGSWALVGLAAAALPTTPSPPAVLWLLLVAALILTVVLLLTAKLIELQGDTLFQRAMSKETLIEDVLTRPWWQAA